MSKRRKHASFARRTHSVYRHQALRAKEHGATLNYTLAELRNVVRAELEHPCPYCGDALTVQTFGLDHDRPVSRGGEWSVANLVVCCAPCNRAKGNMDRREY